MEAMEAMEAMHQQIRDLIGANLLDEPGRKLLAGLGDAESLIDAGLLDSLGVVQMVALLEGSFGIVFDPLDIAVENLDSVDKIAALVERRRAG